jgi:uroporphyrinogen-III decarboxylase
MMTPRERILTLLSGRRPDQVPWFGDLDYWATALIAQGKRPAAFKGSAEYIEWHRSLGVGFYLQGYFPFRAVPDLEERVWNEGNRRYRELVTPHGVLRECWEYLPESYAEAPIEHLVKSELDLPALRYLYEHTDWVPDYDFARRRREEIGDQGILLCYLPKSPFMHLVALEAGIAAVTFAEVAAPDEFAETLSVMRVAFDRAAELAVQSPAEVLMIPENLSAEMIGPRYFEKYMRVYQEHWIRRIAAAGKHSFIHMDGTLKGLLREEASTGVTVIEAMTPEPVGDLPIERWAEKAANPATVLWGGLPGVYFTAKVDDAEFDRHVRAVLEVMRSSPRYVLGVADQVPPDCLERRVRRVEELVEQFGAFTDVRATTGPPGI